jgi:hypothetical protein
MSSDSLHAAVADSVAYLGSPEAEASIARDPYWPKWHSPWWHVLALEEAGHLDAVPAGVLLALMERTRQHFVPSFPVDPSELPAGKDWWLDVICPGALSTLLRVLLMRGIDGEAGIPWARGWLVRYPLPDGGFNCDEKAYARREPRSSILSTLPPLEYLLALGERRALAVPELAVLDRGAAYLLAHQLVCSVRTGHVVRADWLVPSRPRFYEYDALRGLAFVVRWAERYRRPVVRRSIAVARGELGRRLWPDGDRAVRRWHDQQQTRLSTSPGEDGWGPVTTFPLLGALSGTSAGRALIDAEWRDVQAALGRLERDGLLTPAVVAGKP